MLKRLFHILILPALLVSNLYGQISPTDGDSLYWEQMIDGKRKEFDVLKESMKLYMTMAENAADEFGRKLEEDRLRLHQVNYMLAMNEGNPFEFKMACFELSRQTFMFNRDLERIESLVGKTENYLDIVGKSRDELLSMKGLKPSVKEMMGIESSLKALTQFESNLKEIQAKLHKVVVPGRELLAEREKRIDGLKDNILENLKSNIFASEGAVYEPVFWMFMPHSFKRWLYRAPDFAQHKLPESNERWIKFLGTSVCSSLVLWLLLTYVFRRRIELCSRLKPGTGMLLKRGVFFASVAVGMLLGAMSISMPGNILFLHFGVAMVAAAALDIGWALKMLFSGATRKTSPLHALFVAYLIGIVMQAFDVPPMALTVIWLPLMGALAFVCWLLWRDPDSGLALWQRFGILATAFMAFSSFALAFFGFAQLAVILVKSWFMLAVSFQFASSLSAYLKDYTEHRNSMGSIVRSLALGFAIPAIWLMMICCAIFWLAWQLLDIRSCIELCLYTFTIGDAGFSLVSLVFCLFLFFMIKTSLGVLCSAIDRNADGSLVAPGVVTPFKTLVSCVLWTVYSLIIVKTFGVNLSHLGVILGGLSVGLGFGLQNFVNNLVSGLMLLVGRDIREGDTIQIGDSWAKIQKISLRSTLACTSDNAIISIPNSNIISSQLTNWTLNNKHIRRDLKVPLSAGYDIDQATKTLLKIASDSKFIMQIPAPEVFILSVGAPGAILSLRIWIRDIEQADAAISEINGKIEKSIFK